MKKKSKNLYQQTDKFIKQLKKRIRVEFNRLSVTSFDELNVISTKKTTSEMYDRLKEFNENGYLDIIQHVWKFTEGMLTEEEIKKLKEKTSARKLLAFALAAYNPITGYLYESESDRKRMRLNEEIMTARQYSDRVLFLAAIKKSANLWFTQSSQYAIDIADITEVELLKKAGIKKVVWKTEKDDRVCKTCRERDEVVYKIGEVPVKPHYNCRCWLEVYRES